MAILDGVGDKIVALIRAEIIDPVVGFPTWAFHEAIGLVALLPLSYWIGLVMGGTAYYFLKNWAVGFLLVGLGIWIAAQFGVGHG